MKELPKFVIIYKYRSFTDLGGVMGKTDFRERALSFDSYKDAEKMEQSLKFEAGHIEKMVKDVKMYQVQLVEIL